MIVQPRASASVYIGLENGSISPQQALYDGSLLISDLHTFIQFTKCFRRFDFNSKNAELGPNVKSGGYSPLRPSKRGPLQGLQIIDFTRLLPGPLATMFLADMGADVIKIEDPDNPDYVRNYEPKVAQVGSYYLALNRSKRSLALNYYREEGKKIVRDLAAQADVLIEQFRPGVMKSIGLGYDVLSAINPKLIYVSISGYGQDSSLSNFAGHDLNYQAMAGAISVKF